MAQFFFDITERKAAEARLTTMFEELNHRVKNNLAAVSSLLSLQGQSASRAGQGRAGQGGLAHPVHRRGARGAARRSGAAARSTWPTISTISAVTCAPRCSIHDRVRLELETEPISLTRGTAAPLGIVVNELVTNAIKHAYPPPASGTIWVRLARRGEGAVLTVEDHGPGLPSGGAATGGLGLRLLEPMVRQVGGALAIRRDGGARFEISFA